MPNKSNKRNTWLKSQRDKDLFDVYRQALQEKDMANQREAVNYVRKHAAPRFYISAQASASYINTMLAGKPLPNLNSSSRRRLQEIMSRFQRMRRQGRYKRLSNYALCQIIVEQQAPEFYVGYEMASKIICRESKLHNDMIARRMMI